VIRLVALLVAIGALLPRYALASPSKEFVEARTIFRAGQYGEAIALFNGLLYPTSRLSDQQELADAHLLLAVCYYETGKREFAEREFEEALTLRPELHIEAFGFSRSATEFFEARRRVIEERARQVAERERSARERRRLLAAVNRLKVKEQPNILLNLVPFGVGQFQNGERGRALFFGLTEVVLGGASVALWAYQLRYGGSVPPDEVDAVRNIQVLQITTGTLCLAVMGWGIIDAFSRYKGARFRPLTDEEKREYIRQVEAEPPPRRSLRLRPALSPEGAGAVLSWEF